MTVQINYKKSSSKKNSSNLVLFAGDKFNVSSLKKHILSSEYSFISDLLKTANLTKKIVTFPNAENVREVASIVPRDRLLIETDAPWLSPVPFRGKTNEPSYLLETAKFLASHLKMDFEELCAVTSRNFFDLFKPGDKDEQH